MMVCGGILHYRVSGIFVISKEYFERYHRPFDMFFERVIHCFDSESHACYTVLVIIST